MAGGAQGDKPQGLSSANGEADSQTTGLVS